MKSIFTIILLLLQALATSAQDAQDSEREYRNGIMPVPIPKIEASAYADSLRLPELDYNGRVRSINSWCYPMFGYGIGNWDVHQGININLGLSAFTSFGKHNFSGWGRNFSAVYAKPINNKLSIALGGYLNSISSGRGNYID